MRFKDIFSLIMVTLCLGVIAFGAFWVSSRFVPDDKYYIKATQQYERVKGGDLVLSKEETLKFFRHSAEIEKTYYESFKLLSEALHWSAIFFRVYGNNSIVFTFKCL